MIAALPFSSASPHPFKVSSFETPLGGMLVITDEEALYLLEFSDWRGLDNTVEKLSAKTQREIISGTTMITKFVQRELADYFEGKIRSFKTPLRPLGTPFQREAWEALKKVPYGKTQSYKEQAFTVGNPLGVRAVARANATNPIAILIPCHRIINHNGELGGYGGGLDRKKWLLTHERERLFRQNFGHFG